MSKTNASSAGSRTTANSRQLPDKSPDRELAALERFDVWNGRKDFGKFHIEWAMGFRTHLEQAKGATGKPLGKSTSRAILATLREFTLWLSRQDGFRSAIRASDADYFNLSRRDEAEARAAPARPAPSMNQARRALATMPETTPREMRDKGGVCAAVSDRHSRWRVDLSAPEARRSGEKSVIQNPREVATKFGKSIDTFFARGFPEAEAALRAWITYLDDEALYGLDDPLFPATAIAPNSNTGFAVEGFERRPWQNTEPVRKILNAAFRVANLDSFGPHAFRHMHARHAARTCTSVAEIVATPQNLGHTDVLTTLRSYGQISRERQRDLITGESGGDVVDD